MVMTDLNNIELTAAFIEDMLNIKVKKVTPVNPYNFASYKKEYEELEKKFKKIDVAYTQVDIKVELDSGKIVIIEMQRYTDTRFRKRMLFYILKNFVDSYKEDIDDNYSTLKPTYGIAILDKISPSMPNAAKMTARMLFEASLEPVVDKSSDVEDYIKLVEFYLKASDNDPKMKMWQDFFLFGKINERAPYLERAIQRIERATKEEKDMMHSIEKKQKHAEYLKEDIKEQTRFNILSIIDLIKDGKDLNEIIATTGLPPEEVIPVFDRCKTLMDVSR
ncbi:PD-(D/E)XK nuclease family transposase [Aerococcaceae bacterium NML180378]|nr:PD-(D/E)XK nuclease family transposase [Aerococcaceae bacterium NML180378]